MGFSSNLYFMFFMVYSLVALLLSAPVPTSSAFSDPASGELNPRRLFTLNRKTVIIINSLTNKLTLNFHCKSGDDDLGLRSLPSGQSWEFKFRVNFMRTTKYSCIFSWHTGGSHEFDIFTVDRDNNDAGRPRRVCIWEVVGEGREKPICRKRRDNRPDWCFDWKP